MGRLAGSPDSKVSDFDYKDLPPLLSEIKSDSYDKSYKLASTDDIPAYVKLEDLFKEMPDYVLYSMDLKSADLRTARIVHEIIKA